MLSSLYKTLIDDLVGRNYSIMASEGIEPNMAVSLVYGAGDNTKLSENGVGVSVYTTREPGNMTSSMTSSYPSYGNTSYTTLAGNLSEDDNSSVRPDAFCLLDNNEMTQ